MDRALILLVISFVRMLHQLNEAFEQDSRITRTDPHHVNIIKKTIP